MIAVTYLGSGSEGNSALLEFGEVRFLLDAGLSARRIRKFLQSRGIDPASLAGVILTHDHGDHVRGLPNFLKAAPVPVLTTEPTRRALIHQGCALPGIVPLRPGQELERDGVRLRPFRLPHDAADPIGIRAEWQGKAVTIATDLGGLPPQLFDHLPGTDILCLESNHEPAMLQSCGYPDWLKRRIAGPRGHLPNQAVGTVLQRLDQALAHLVLIHLSQESNHPAVAWQALVPFLRHPPLRGCRVTLATQHEPTPRLSTPPAGISAPSRPGPVKAVQHRFEFAAQEPDLPCASTS